MIKDDFRLYQMGESALTIESIGVVNVEVQRKIWQISRLYRDIDHLVDVVPGMNNLTLIFEPCRADLVHESERLVHLWRNSQPPKRNEGRLVEIPVIYGGDAGPDLSNVAEHCCLSEEDVIASHSGGEYIVYFLGFQPGFAYLGGMDEQLCTPRHASPRSKVPKGSVAIGGAQTGVYPNTSPGGWQIIGKTEVELFDPLRDQPSIWLPGDRVKFIVRENGND